MQDDEDDIASRKKFLRMSDLKSEYGLFPASVYRWIGEGIFPLPVCLGPNTVAWRREEIKAWELTRPRAKIKQLRTRTAAEA
ncbi:MAG: helix-turn-helix transcriptional regulator [Rhodomicrobium sp.]